MHSEEMKQSHKLQIRGMYKGKTHREKIRWECRLQTEVHSKAVRLQLRKEMETVKKQVIKKEIIKKEIIDKEKIKNQEHKSRKFFG